MYGYIYLTENLINGKCYIGKHKSSSFDENYKGSGKYLSNAIKKYGENNFITTIVKCCNTLEKLDEEEKYYIKKCNAVDSKYFYNILEGGSGGWDYVNKSKLNVHHTKFSHTQAAKEKMRLSALNRKPHSKETNLKKANHRGKHPLAKKLICVELNKEYSCIIDAAEDLKINYEVLKYHINKYGNYKNLYTFVLL